MQHKYDSLGYSDGTYPMRTDVPHQADPAHVAAFNTGKPEPKVPSGKLTSIPAHLSHLAPKNATGEEVLAIINAYLESAEAGSAEFGTPAKQPPGSCDASHSPWMTAHQQSLDASTLRVQANGGGTIRTGSSGKR